MLRYSVSHITWTPVLAPFYIKKSACDHSAKPAGFLNCWVGFVLNQRFWNVSIFEPAIKRFMMFHWQPATSVFHPAYPKVQEDADEGGAISSVVAMC